MWGQTPQQGNEETVPIETWETGELTEWVEAYSAGELTMDELAAKVIAHEFTVPDNVSVGGFDGFYENEIPSGVPEVGSWYELQFVARDYQPNDTGPYGLMTAEEFADLSQRLIDARGRKGDKAAAK